MIPFRQMICPVSPERIDENRVRATALGVIVIMGVYFLTGNVLFPVYLTLDFAIRAFTKLNHSPLSWLAWLFVRSFGTSAIWIPKAPKIFAARIGFILTLLTSIFTSVGMSPVSVMLGSTLVVFAFLECGLNFCAGCWIYTYVVYPLVRKDQ
jgi:hypothetical protein